MVSVKFGKICNIGGMNVGMPVLCRFQVLPKIIGLIAKILSKAHEKWHCVTHYNTKVAMLGSAKSV